ncbi:VanZ family protein [Kutzneria sp. 744]|uniref:VanZ family protein n=1 Tax=Kutzneria sp. (strain 744) TaxID=345341 RepID=UPI0003EED41C|nr:VanZ family protein [Kutzneria sp. 744]EWM13247.1 vegetative cell wall protein gp1 [Kutzneria sp. 744]
MLRDWHAWFGTFTGVVALTVLALPVAALMVWLLTLRGKLLRMALAEVGLVYGTVPGVWLILLPGGPAGSNRVSLIPLRDLSAVLAAGPSTAVAQVVGNLLVFAALGFFAPIRFSALACAPRILALGAGCSVFVETLQYVLQLGRVSSVDDVLLNAAGALLAALASRHWWRVSVGVKS